MQFALISACSSLPTGTKSLVMLPMHHAGSVLEHIVFHVLAEAQDVKGLIGKLHVLPVVDGGHSQLALGHIPVVLDVVGQEAFLLQILNLIRHQVVESMVATLERLL